MKLATTTGDFNSYTGSQITSLRYIREAGFRYPIIPSASITPPAAVCMPRITRLTLSA